MSVRYARSKPVSPWRGCQVLLVTPVYCRKLVVVVAGNWVLQSVNNGLFKDEQRCASRAVFVSS